MYGVIFIKLYNKCRKLWCEKDKKEKENSHHNYERLPIKWIIQYNLDKKGQN